MILFQLIADRFHRDCLHLIPFSTSDRRFFMVFWLLYCPIFDSLREIHINMDRHCFHSAGTRHLKLQTIFEDNRNSLIEEHRPRPRVIWCPFDFAQFRTTPVLVSMVLRLVPKQRYGRHPRWNICQDTEPFPLDSSGVFRVPTWNPEVFYGQRVEQQQAVPQLEQA